MAKKKSCVMKGHIRFGKDVGLQGGEKNEAKNIC